MQADFPPDPSRIPVASDRRPPPIGLSSVQRRVLETSAAGAPTSEVATLLGMSVNEVREHLARAIALLGARSKLGAVIRALRLGLIRLPG